MKKSSLVILLSVTSLCAAAFGARENLVVNFEYQCAYHSSPTSPARAVNVKCENGNLEVAEATPSHTIAVKIRNSVISRHQRVVEIAGTQSVYDRSYETFGDQGTDSGVVGLFAGVNHRDCNRGTEFYMDISASMLRGQDAGIIILHHYYLADFRQNPDKSNLSCERVK